MSFYQFIQEESSWKEFLEEQENKEFPDNRAIKQISKIVESKSYTQFNEEFFKNFKLAKVKRIKKYNTKKVRIVYVYPGKWRISLKMMAFYILKKYNNKFARNSIAYTKGKSPKTAFSIFKSFRIKKSDVIYKNDFSNYFNSIDIDLLEDKLKVFLKDDMDLCDCIMGLLREPHVVDKGKVVVDNHKGVMAGSPISGILANIFMHDIDKKMLKKRYKYIRYADDTLIIGKKALDFFKTEIEKLNISFNPKKEEIFNIETGITFLGFKHIGKTIDISDGALKKMKSRFKRRAKWYRIWMKKRKVKKEVTIKDYIKKINYKLYSQQEDSINWSRWYLPNINTIESIKYLDQYFISCIRYLDSGTWTKGKAFYRLSYNDIKGFGFKSLVNEYYKIKLDKKVQNKAK